MQITAKRRFIRMTPDKIRILANLVNKKNPDGAITQLEFSQRAAAKPIILTLKQAKDQIKDKGLDAEKFTVREFRVDEGPKLKRRRIRHQGRATAILKRHAHLTIILEDNTTKSMANEKKKEITSTDRMEQNGTKS